MGALPILHGATSPDAAGGACYGPDVKGHLADHPTVMGLPEPARDGSLRERTVALPGIDADLVVQVQRHSPERWMPVASR